MPLCGGTKTVQRKLVLLYVTPADEASTSSVTQKAILGSESTLHEG